MMSSFAVQSELRGEPETIAADILTMAGVNAKLMPIVRMTAPTQWRQTPIYRWPTADHLFDSTLLLFGAIPVDIHRFGLIETGLYGINEQFRICFIWEEGHAYEVDITDYH